MPGEPLPTTYFLLFSFVIVGFMGVVVWLVKRVVNQQDRLASTIDGHLTTLYKQQVEILSELKASGSARETLMPRFSEMASRVDMMSDKMLDVILRLAEGIKVTAAAAQVNAQAQASPRQVEIVSPIASSGSVDVDQKKNG